MPPGSQPGDKNGLIGANGTGNSTLLRIITRITLESGEIAKYGALPSVF